MAANPILRDPYAAYQQPATADPYAAYQQPVAAATPQDAYVPPAGNIIRAAAAPSLLDRARGVVANSAIGHALESTLPAVSDALHLHPTETVNSPTYQSDRDQVIAPQYLLPDPQSGAGHVVRGALSGVGSLTSGRNLATAAGVAAAAGLAAPIVAGAGGAAAAARIAGGAAKLGMAGLGAKGVYDQGKQAVDLYGKGDTSGAEEALGEMLPNAALTVPALGEPLAWAGDRAQLAGVKVLDSYLKAGKVAHRYDAAPGLGVLQEGPGTSLAFTRQAFADKVQSAANRTGAAIRPLVDAARGEVPRSDLGQAVNSVINDKNAVLNGPGGNPSATTRMEDLRGTFAPLTSGPGNASVSELYDAKRNMDQNINWNRSLDPVDATANNANREIRSSIAGKLYEAAPELKGPSQQYSNLIGASKLANDRVFDPSSSLLSPFRLATGATAGVSAGAATHNPVLGAASGLLAGILPEVVKAPIVKTGAATGLFQAGKLASAAGRSLKAFQPFEFGKELGNASERNNAYGEDAQHNQDQSYHVPSPNAGLYGRTNLTPEIIRPMDMSRSRFGIGSDGRAGVLIRPLAALPAPPRPAPRATPFEWTPKAVEALPAASHEGLFDQVGSRAHVVPDRLLGPLYSGGSVEEREAALRRAQLGSLGNVVPLRSVAPLNKKP